MKTEPSKLFVLILICLGAGTHYSLAATVPAGTPIIVRTAGAISSHATPGRTFTAKLDQDIAINGTVALRAGTQFSGIIHESLRFDGKPGRLTGDLLHYTVRSFQEHETNVDRYSTLAAQQMFAQGQRSWRPAMWFATPWSWFQNFVLRGGFLDGYRGALISQMAARSVRLKYAKLGKLIASKRHLGAANS